MLRLLVVDNTRKHGGAFLSLLDIIENFRSRGVNVTLIASQTTPEYLDRVKTDRFIYMNFYRREFDRTPEPSSKERNTLHGLWKRTARFGPTIECFREISRLYKVTSRLSFDLIYLNNSASSQFSCILFGALKNIPIVVHTRGFEEIGFCQRFISRFVKKYIAISRAVERNLVRGGIPAEKISQIYNPFNIANYLNKEPERFALKSEFPATKLLGHFGRLIPWKGVFELVQSLAVDLRHNKTWHLLLVGETANLAPEYKSRIECLIEQEGIEENVHFLGMRADYLEIMSGCDVVIHHSIEPEPLGRVAIEAFAVRTPVIASHLGGPSEVVEDDVDGRLFDPYSTQSFRSALKDAINNRKRYTLNGQKKFLDMFGASQFDALFSIVQENAMHTDRDRSASLSFTKPDS